MLILILTLLALQLIRTLLIYIMPLIIDEVAYQEYQQRPLAIFKVTISILFWALLMKVFPAENDHLIAVFYHAAVLLWIAVLGLPLCVILQGMVKKTVINFNKIRVIKKY